LFHCKEKSSKGIVVVGFLPKRYFFRLLILPRAAGLLSPLLYCFLGGLRHGLPTSVGLQRRSHHRFLLVCYQFHLLARTLSFLETIGPVFNYQGLATADRLKVVVLLKGDLLIYQIHQIVLE
jgi:hypothetical protein